MLLTHPLTHTPVAKVTTVSKCSCPTAMTHLTAGLPFVVLALAALAHPTAATLVITAADGSASEPFASPRFAVWAGPADYEYSFAIDLLLDAGRLSDFCDPVSAHERLEKLDGRAVLVGWNGAIAACVPEEAYYNLADAGAMAVLAT